MKVDGRFDVFCVGHASYDHVFAVDHHPAPDEKMFAGNLVGCGGGPLRMRRLRFLGLVTGQVFPVTSEMTCTVRCTLQS